MERKRVNTLYSLLMCIDARMIIESYFTEMMNSGRVLVNNTKVTATDINKTVYLNDVIQYKDQKYLVGADKLELI